MAVVPPAAFYWALADRESRWGTGVLAVAALGLSVLVAMLLAQRLLLLEGIGQA